MHPWEYLCGWHLHNFQFIILVNGTLFTPKLIYCRYFLCILYTLHLPHEKESYFSMKKTHKKKCCKCQTVGFYVHPKAEISHSPETVEQVQLKFPGAPCHTNCPFFFHSNKGMFGHEIFLLILRIYRIIPWISQMAKFCLNSFWSEKSLSSSKAFRHIFLLTFCFYVILKY